MSNAESMGGCPMSRRRFLQGIGAGAAVSAVGFRPDQALAETSAQSGTALATFGRMFPTLGPFAKAGPALTEALLDIGRPGGVLDAGDNLSVGPFQLLVDPALQVNNTNNPNLTAGFTFMGQFLDHDVTFDIGSTLNVPTDPSEATNARTPKLDLDSIYGGGPTASSHLYDPADRAKLRLESGGRFEDLPRTSGCS